MDFEQLFREVSKPTLRPEGIRDFAGLLSDPKSRVAFFGIYLEAPDEFVSFLEALSNSGAEGEALVARALSMEDVVERLVRKDRTDDVLRLVSGLDGAQQTEVLAAPDVVRALADRADAVWDIISALRPQQQTRILSAPPAVWWLAYKGKGREVWSVIANAPANDQARILAAQHAISGLALYGYKEQVGSLRQRLARVVTAPDGGVVSWSPKCGTGLGGGFGAAASSVVSAGLEVLLVVGAAQELVERGGIDEVWHAIAVREPAWQAEFLSAPDMVRLLVVNGKADAVWDHVMGFTHAEQTRILTAPHATWALAGTKKGADDVWKIITRASREVQAEILSAEGAVSGLEPHGYTFLISRLRAQIASDKRLTPS